MKLLILPSIEEFQGQHQVSAQASFEDLIKTLNVKCFRKYENIIEIKGDALDQVEIDSNMESVDIDTLLDPAKPDTRSMEVMITIKRQLRHQLESMVFAKKN